MNGTQTGGTLGAKRVLDGARKIPASSGRMNVTQSRMARAALGWSLDQLAASSGISRRTVAKFEAGEKVSPETVEALRAAFVAEGIAFDNGGKRAGVSYIRRD